MKVYKTKFNKSREVTLICEEGAEYKAETFDSPETVVKITNDLFDLQNQTEEYLYCFCLNNANKIIGLFEVSHGTVNGTLMDARSIFIKALKLDAVSIVLVHNHPSGDPSPSGPDKEGTRKIKAGAELIGITLLDHIIIGWDNFHSMKRNHEI